MKLKSICTHTPLLLQLVAFLIIAPSILSGQADVKFVNDYLNIGVGARGQGMSGSVTATVDDITASYWNPAGLALVESPGQLSAMHASWFGGIANYDFISGGKRFNSDKQSYGAISLIRLGVDNIPNTLNLFGADGSIDYDRIEEFSVANYAIFLSYGQKLGDKGLSIGGSTKVLYQRLGSFGNAVGFGFDAGLMYRKGNLRAGLMLRDITTTLNFWSFSISPEDQLTLLETGNEVPVSNTEVALPKIVFGLGYEVQANDNFSYLIETDVRISSDGTKSGVFSGKNIGIDPSLGLELSYKDMVSLRVGVGNLQTIIDNTTETSFELQPNIGLGLDFGKVALDYSLTNVGNISGALISHIFSLTIDLNSERL